MINLLVLLVNLLMLTFTGVVLDEKQCVPDQPQNEGTVQYNIMMVSCLTMDSINEEKQGDGLFAEPLKQ